MAAKQKRRAGAERSLAGRHIAITRAAEQAPALARRLEWLGARVTILSTIGIEPLQDTAQLDAAIGNFGSYDWIVLTSVNGVRAFAERLAACGRTWDDRQRARIAVIGPATAEALKRYGVSPDLMPAEYVAEAILAGLGNVAGQRILLVRADIARRALAEQLAVRGAEVDEVAAYRTVTRALPAEALEKLLGADRPDAITFTSSSTVHGLAEALREAGRDPQQTLAGIALVSIGPITAATLRGYALEPAVTATEYTMPGLVRALVAYFSGAE
jgi:uroporphyrinogen-III synthase